MKTTTPLVKHLGLTLILCLLFNVLNTNAQIRMTKVDPFTDEVTIKNFGTATVDISGYYFCTKITYGALSSATIVNGSLNLTTGSEVTLVVNTASGLDNVASDLSIYFNNSGFGEATNMADFMQYGDDFPVGSGREPQAVTQGLWTAGDFILGNPAPWSYTGSDGTQNGVSFWVSSSTLSVNDEFLNSVISIYPSPAKEDLNFKMFQQINLKDASIFDMTGRLVEITNLDKRQIQNKISLKTMKSGVYVLKLTDLEGRTLTRKFIKQ